VANPLQAIPLVVFSAAVTPDQALPVLEYPISALPKWVHLVKE